MSVRRLAILSVHTSPLAQPGTGDGGGMNVYVRALAGALARAGVECDVLTRATRDDQPPLVEVEPGFRVVHVPAGPREPLSKHDLHGLLEAFTGAALDLVESGVIDPEVLHANYWLSGGVGHAMKHALDLPLAATFHTLARVKAEAGIDDDPEHRTRIEHEVVACADLVLASTDEERRQLVEHYGADPARVEIVPPGVDHGVFHPEGRAAARARLGLADRRTVLFAGRIQPLKGADLAVRAVGAIDDPSLLLVIVGGPSGVDGDREVARLHGLVRDLGLAGRVRFVPAQPHARLADFYRSADVCLVPSHAESFGLVALEAAACGTPVVAAAVGGLRSLVRHGETGFLIEGRDPSAFAAPVEEIVRDRALAEALGAEAAARSRRYSWSVTAARLRRSYADLTVGSLVSCV